MQRKKTRKRKEPQVPPRFLIAPSEANEQERNSVHMMVDMDKSALGPYLSHGTCRYFVIKSFSEANVHKSIKYGVWSSTYISNNFLDTAFNSDLSCIRPILLFFSVCGSKHFCGVARMTSGLTSNRNFMLWEKTKYDGYFNVEWLVVKDVPNHALKSIVLESNKNITSLRDCDEIPYNEASAFLRTFMTYDSKTSILDDMKHYDKGQLILQAKRGFTDIPSDADVDAFLVAANNNSPA